MYLVRCYNSNPVCFSSIDTVLSTEEAQCGVSSKLDHSLCRLIHFYVCHIWDLQNQKENKKLRTNKFSNNMANFNKKLIFL